MTSSAILSLLAGTLFASGIWIDVPFVEQPENGCGSAVVWMLVEYWSRDGDSSGATGGVDRIHRVLYSPERQGVRVSDMQRFFRSLQFRTFPFAGSWPDLEHHLSRGRPLIAALGPDGRAGPLHYVAVVGIDRERDLILLNDPAGRKLAKWDRGDFERQWETTGNWTLLVVPE